jgi:hypothetical protein
MQWELGGSNPPPLPQKNQSLKDTDFVDTLMLNVQLVYVQPEISYWNRLMTGILEFWKIKLKNYKVFDEIEPF